MAKKILNLDLLLGGVIILIFIGFSYGSFSLLERIEGYVYGAYMKYGAGENLGAPNVVLVDIDDKSLSMLGSWPWPRDLIALMIDKLRRSGAKVIGLNLPFTEKEKNRGFMALERLREKIIAYPLDRKDMTLTTWMLENIKQMKESLDHDGRLVQSILKSGNVILPVYLQRGSPQERTRDVEHVLLSRNFLSPLKLSASLRKTSDIRGLLLPFPELTKSALGLGHGDLTGEKGLAGRSHPLFVTYKGSLLPSFPLRLALAFLGQEPSQALVDENRIQLNGFAIPFSNGEMLVKFQNGQGPYYRYPFVDLLKAKQVIPTLRGRIAVIGLNSRQSRKIGTPISPEMSEGEFIAQVLDNMINKRFVTRPSFMSPVEILLILFLGGAASLIVPRTGQFRRLGLIGSLSFLCLSAGFILLITRGIWFKSTYIASCLVTIYAMFGLKGLLVPRGTSQQAIERNRLLGLGLQSQGHLDRAFEKFRKLPMDYETKELIYNLGIEYERGRHMDKALLAYQYISEGVGFRDVKERIFKLKGTDRPSTSSSQEESTEGSVPSEGPAETRSRVGRYDILEELGKGSMGHVYKALDPKINRLLAIKTIRFSDEFDDDLTQEIKERFFREAEMAGKLSHPLIVTIYDVGEDRDLTYMAMEFLEGMSLQKYVVKGNLLPFRKTLDVVARVAEALEFAHRAGVIHRDIKPANIMLLEDGGIKVTDFGIAKAISSSRTKTGMILGTPNYMSPEQIMGHKIDLRSDIFSLGVLFFQLLTGELPFQGENLNRLLYQITQVKHPSLREYNRKLPLVCDRILDRALAKNAKDRFESAGEMCRIIDLLASKVDELPKDRVAKKKAASR